MQYDEFAQKHNEAYAAFTSVYEAKNPRPHLQSVSRADWYIALVVAVLVIASIIVSGSRTIPEFGGGPVGLSAFIMLECAIVSYSFIRTKNHFNEQRLATVKRWTNGGLLLAFAVSVAANIHGTLRYDSVYIADAINTVILLLLAVSAPTLAFISGDVLAVQYMRADALKRKVDTANNEAIQEWKDGLNRSWASNMKRWDVQISVQPPVQLDTVDTPQLSSGQSSGQRVDNAWTVVQEHLDKHPEDIELSGRDLATKLGVGKSTAYKVLKEYKQ